MIEYAYPTVPGHTLQVDRNRTWTAAYRGEWAGACSCDPSVTFFSPSRLDMVGRWEVHLAEQGFQVGLQVGQGGW